MDAEQRGLSVLDHVPVGVCVLREEGTVAFWNRCLEDWTRIPRGNILDTDIAEHFPHLREPRYWGRLSTIFQGGPPTIFSSQLHKHIFPSPGPKGKLRIQHTTVTSLPEHDVAGHCALIVVKDVTELTLQIDAHRTMRDKALREIDLREKVEQEKAALAAQIQQTEKMKSLDVIAGAIAHNFNNFLMAVLGYLDMGLEDLPPGTAGRDKVEEANAAAKQAAELSTLMLTYVGQGTEPTQLVDLTEAIEKGLATLRDSVPPQVHFRMATVRELPAVKADPDQLQRVLACLVANASEALGNGKQEIAITTGAAYCDSTYLRQTYVDDGLAEGPYVFLEVTDTGCGMDQATVARVFDPFFTTKFPGRGLGLASVLGIVRGHRGAVVVHSEPREGTTFRVLFPAQDRRAEPQPPPSSERRDTQPQAAPSKLTGTILLVDDEEIVRRAGRAVLQRLGMDVLTAADGVEAIEVFADQKDVIRCVLLDLTMPRKDGFEAFQELHSMKASTPIILLSGYCEEEATQRFSGKGVAGFLQKPYKSTELAQILQEVLGE